MDEKIQRLRQLEEALFQEKERERNAKETKEYKELGEKIKELMLEHAAMLPKPEVETEYQDLKQEIMKDMIATNNYYIDGVAPKFQEKKEVNQNRVMEVIGGDFGIFQELASITQAKLKDFAKTQPGLKKPLMACIEVVDRQLKDISIINQ